MTSQRLFLGGHLDGRTLGVDDRLSTLAVPVREPVTYGALVPVSTYETLRTVLYRRQRYMLNAEHPCVRGAAVSRTHEVFHVGPHPDSDGTARAACQSPPIDERRVTINHRDPAPWWWWIPDRGPIALGEFR